MVRMKTATATPWRASVKPIASAKDIRIEPIAAADANACVKRLHYSGKIVRNSQLHLGVFLAGRLEGAMQFGPSLDKRKLIGLVQETPWNGCIELNRMAFSERLPRNSESRALGVAFRLMRRAYPHLQWVVSFADATQSGDGTIYRASGFVLTGIKRNTSIWSAPSGEHLSRTTVTKGRYVVAAVKDAPHKTSSNGAASMRAYKEAGFKPLDGFQLRYVYFLHPDARGRLTVPVLPYNRIDETGAGMYRGKPRAKQATAGPPPVSGGAAPTRALHEIAA